MSENPLQLADRLAGEYLRTGSDEVVRELLREGSLWDAVTRSVIIYARFEQKSGKRFPILWIEDATEEALQEFMEG